MTDTTSQTITDVHGNIVANPNYNPHPAGSPDPNYPTLNDAQATAYAQHNPNYDPYYAGRTSVAGPKPGSPRELRPGVPLDRPSAYSALELDVKTLNRQIDELQRLPNGLTPGADIMLDQIQQTASGLAAKLVAYRA